MAYSKLRSSEEKKQKKRLFYALLGIIGIFVFVIFFGLKILINFSILVDKLRPGSSPNTSPQLLLPPVLDPLPEATNSSDLIISGNGQPGATVMLYVNEKEAKKTIISSDGTFTFSSITGQEGKNTISAKLSTSTGTFSNLSNVISTTVKLSKPTLELSNPTSDTTVNGDDNNITVTGITEPDNTLTINGRFVLLKQDGSFSYAYPLQEGENTLTIKAIDVAGNEATLERKITYNK